MMMCDTIPLLVWRMSQAHHDPTFADSVSRLNSKSSSEALVPNTLTILAVVRSIPEQQEGIEDFYIGSPKKAKHDLYSLNAHKKQAQKAWMALLRQDLGKRQRKSILELMSHRIAPWFLKVELLMDFLTDSFNLGGSTSLLSLSGLFYLIQHKNLDYPQFYSKLYSLLDSNILHSKHRSRFFRLLDTFLASTHLPAGLVASFVKRFARLSLFAPASGIVVVIPWIYNLLKSHPGCTFMIHRNGEVDQHEEMWGDPFRQEESDPMETDALESSLWEVQMLQSHYHPNVATIAKIISEQFTKQAYNLEDFLDHSYGTVSVLVVFATLILLTGHRCSTRNYQKISKSHQRSSMRYLRRYLWSATETAPRKIACLLSCGASTSMIRNRETARFKAVSKKISMHASAVDWPTVVFTMPEDICQSVVAEAKDYSA